LDISIFLLFLCFLIDGIAYHNVITLKIFEKKHALTLWLLVVTPEQRVKTGTLLEPIVVHSNPKESQAIAGVHSAH